MSPTVYLVTGAARGIGFSIVQQLSTRPDTIIFAGVRSLPLAADSQLHKLSRKIPGNVLPIVINSADEGDNAAAAEVVKAKVGKVDVIIANAGVFSGVTPINDINSATLISDFTINAVGPIVLFKAFSTLLEAASKATPGSAKFIVISTAVAQITNPLPFPANSYGTSKAAVNFLVSKINLEHPSITAFPVHPGMVATDMGKSGAESFGTTLEAMGAITPEECATAIITVVDKAKKETHGGKFWNYDGSELLY